MRWIVYTTYGQKEIEEAFYSEKEAIAYIMTCKGADETHMDTRWQECGCLVSDKCECAGVSEDEKCYHCDATAGLVWTEGYGGVHVCEFCKALDDNACGMCDKQSDGTFKKHEDGFLRCPECEHD